MKRALVTGICGQDGSYLTELLLSKGYDVHGVVRRSSRGYGALENILHLVRDESIYRKTLHLHTGDMTDAASLHRIVGEVQPDEIYNLAAQADVMESFQLPEMTVDVNGTGVLRLLEAVRQRCPTARVYQASTSELFGAAMETPQTEKTPFWPQSPYSIGKLAGFHAIRKYHDAYGIFASTGVLFNHESPRRGDDYLTRKVTKAVARIVTGKQKELRLGNLEAKRDWGYAPEYVEAAWRMLQHPEAGYWVIGTGETHTVQEWVDAAFAVVNLDPSKYVVQDNRLFRPAEVDVLQADYSDAKKTLGWEPKVRFAELVKLMVQADLAWEGAAIGTV